MTELLQKAFTEASKLPDQEQDSLAVRILEEIEDERRWEEAFARSQGVLERLAEEALLEHRQGKTQARNMTGYCSSFRAERV